MPQDKTIFEKTYENGWYKKLVRRSKPTGNFIKAYLRSPNGETFQSPKSLLRYMKSHPEFWKTFDALEINFEKEVDFTTKLSNDTLLLIDFFDEKQSDIEVKKSRLADNFITLLEERSCDITPIGKCRNEFQLDSYSSHQKTTLTLSSASAKAGSAMTETARRPSIVSISSLGKVSKTVNNILSTVSTFLSPASAGSPSESGATTAIKTMTSTKPSCLSSSNAEISEDVKNQSLSIKKQQQGSIVISSSTSVKLHKIGGDQSRVGIQQQLIRQDGDSFKSSDHKRSTYEPLDKIALSADSENPGLSGLLENPQYPATTVPPPRQTKWHQEFRKKLSSKGVIRKFSSFHPAKMAAANWNSKREKASMNNIENMGLISKKELQYIIKVSKKKLNLLKRKKSKNILKVLAITNLKWKAKRLYTEEKVAKMYSIPACNKIWYCKFEKFIRKQEEVACFKEIKLNSKTIYNEEKENKISTAISNRNVIREFEKIFIKQEKLPSSQQIQIWGDKYKVSYEFVENYFVEQWNGKMKHELLTARIQKPNEERNCDVKTFDQNPDLSFVINDSYVIEIDNAEKGKSSN